MGLSCVECKRPMRANGTRKEDHTPGLLRHGGRGLCDSCYGRNQRHGTLERYPATRMGQQVGVAPPDSPKCSECKRPIRSGHHTLAERPGTVKGVKGHCYGCHPIVTLGINPERVERARRELNDYLAWRRPYRARAGAL